MNSKGVDATAAVSSSTAASVYDVFLSFCGKDTRKHFTDYLYNDLIDANIKTFRDNDELEVGKKIGPELLKAIEDSKISIPIFSQNYASSKWCLRELEHIVKCYENGEHKIYPIFYDVVPSDVRNQRGSYAEAFRLHGEKSNEDTIQSWRHALKVVGELKGLELKIEADGREGEFAKKIVKKIVKELKKNYMDLPQTDLVGMDNHIEELRRLLEVDSDDVRIVGIHGMGGLGKTTMTKVIYNQMCSNFDGQWFFDNVREKSKDKDGFAEMQTGISNVSDGRNNGKKLLLVLDDIDDYIQVRRLMGELIRYGARSRIILTTRNKEVLDKFEENCQRKYPLVVYKSYIPQFMDNSDSLKLFSKYAFEQDFPMEEYKILSKEVVSIAAGLPLALVVLGSTFSATDKDVWEEKVKKLREMPHKEVFKKLAVSFEALDNTEKEIFLDIACLFVDHTKGKPIYMWEACGLNPKSGISVLVNRSLITIDDKNRFRMHAQLRDLGREIVREEGVHGKQSRIWRLEEALQVLKITQETRCVKALCLEYQYNAVVAAPHFPHLPNLRYLSMEKVENVDGDFKDLLSNLRWLKCTNMLGNFSLRNLNMTNLVVLHLFNIQGLTDDWDGWRQLKMTNNLKALDLLYCGDLQTLPNLSNLTKLVELQLCSCWKLTEIQGLQKLEFLQVLKIRGCWSLTRLPNISSLKDLKVFNVFDCRELSQIEGLSGLISLEYLKLYGCDSLKEGLGDFSNLNKLQVLKGAAGCLDLTTDFSNFKKLKKLEIYKSNRIEIQNLVGLEALEHLKICECSSIVRLPNLSYLIRLKVLAIKKCEQLIEIPDLSELKSLEELAIYECRSVKALPDLSHLQKLKLLVVSQCVELSEISEINGLKSLEWLTISRCSSVKALPDLSPLQKLEHLDVSYCVKLGEIRGIQELKCLIDLFIRGSKGLEYLRDLPNTRIQLALGRSGEQEYTTD